MTTVVGPLVGEASHRPAGGGSVPAVGAPAATPRDDAHESGSGAGSAITVVGAKGGQGTSTVAAVLAIFAAGHQPTELVAPDAVPILGVADPSDGGPGVPVLANLTLTGTAGRAGVAILDAGTLAGRAVAGSTYTVVRGPCYLALRTMLGRGGPLPDGVILVAEEGRSLTQRDVEDVTGAPVVARVEHTPRVARLIDAGLLIAQLHHLNEFRDLRRLAARLFGPVPTDRAVA
jgi:hypothetical protein